MQPQLLGQGSYTRTYGAASDGVHAMFKWVPVLDPVASAQQGREVYNDHEFVEMIFPGDPTKKPVFRVTDEHRQRWPELYKAFKDRREMAATGTPLEMWPMLGPSQVYELKYLNFRTVEDVADMNDLALQKVGMGGRRLKDLAAAFLDDAQAQALATSLEAENSKKDAQIAALSNQVEELGKIVNRLHSAQMAQADAQHPIATTIPGMHDPVEQAKLGLTPPAPAQSSLADLPQPRKRKSEGVPA